MNVNMALTDTNLHLDEVEGLIRAGGTSGVGSGQSRSNRNSSYWDQLMVKSCAPKNRKSGMLIGFLGALLLLIVAANAGGGGANGSPSTGSGSGADSRTEISASQVKTASTREDVIWVDPEPVNVGGNAGGRLITTGEVVTVETPPPTSLSTPEANQPNVEEVKADVVVDPTKETPAATSAPETTPPPEEKKKEELEPKPKVNSKIPLLESDMESGPIPDGKRAKLAKNHGSWNFWDGEEEARPKDDYMSKHPNKDIPGDEFPEHSWQTDAVYVNHFLNDADKLIDRTMEAIFTEYGHGKPLPPEEMATRMKMFHWEKINMTASNEPPLEFSKRGNRDIGGWTSKRSFDGLVRRLLHAMITRDTFTVLLAGHSAAQGQGNHFRQSYAMQFHRIMKPIFARLGVKLVTHNMAQGGLGTLQGGMGARDIYGQDIDLFLWDSGMTEGGAPHHVDLVLRQVLMSGTRAPIMWGGPFELLKLYHEEADADVGEWGNGYAGLPETTDEVQAETLPWAARQMKCSSERQDLCNENRYNSVCWINRTDGIKPAQGQRARPRGQVKWHPGWRPHQLQGRVLAFAVLEGLEVAVNTWMEGTMTGQPLDDGYWHVTEYYENIRSKVKNMNQTLGRCPEIAQEDQLPIRMCNTPMNGRTQYTPRADYDGASLNSIVKAAPNGWIPKNELKALYEGPDMHNPAFDIPEGQIDVLSIVMGRRRRHRRLSEHHQQQVTLPKVDHLDVMQHQQEVQQPSTTSLRRKLDEEIVPGEGWDVAMEPQGLCDGKYESVCNHETHEECFLLQHHDQRGAIVGCEWSGWLVMTLKALKEGIIVLKIHTWHVDSENPRTKRWSSVSGKRRLGEASDAEVPQDDTEYFAGDLAYPEMDSTPPRGGRRNLKMRSYATPELPDSFAFDFAINGKITSLNNTEFMDKKKNLQRVVETLTLLDDPDFTKEAQDVEVAVRMRGVNRTMFFGMSHIYWA